MIRLRFSAGIGPAAWLVRSWTGSWCAHVGFDLGEGWTLDATPEHGVAKRRATDDATTLYFDVRGNEKEILPHAFGQISKPYDFKGALGLGLHRDWQDPGHWFCSELVAWAFNQGGNRLLRTEHMDRISPRDLLLSPRLIPVKNGGMGAATPRAARGNLA